MLAPWLRGIFRPFVTHATRTVRNRGRRRAQLYLEYLEDRVVPALTNPTWVEQGPAGFQFPPFIPNQPVDPSTLYVGAFTALATVPGKPDVLFAGSQSGGVWRTLNANAAVPDWTPISDNAPNLTIQDLKVDPNDPSGNTLYAATPFGAGLGGVLKISNALAAPTFTFLGGQTLANERLTKVVVTTLNGGAVLLAASRDSGVYRSSDSGATWNLVAGIPAAVTKFTDLVADPGDANRFYAAAAGAGVFVSTNGGANWTAVNNGPLANVANNEPVTGTQRILLGVHNSAGNNVLYAGLIFGAGQTEFSSVYRSTDQGATWKAMALVVDEKGNDLGGAAFDGSRAFLAVHPTNPNVVFVGGIGNSVRGDASVADPKQQWKTYSRGSDGSSPYVDPRIELFDTAGNLLQGDDGGVWRLTNPDDSIKRVWRGLNANLRVADLYSAAYDALNGVTQVSLQDTGTVRQDAPGSFSSVALTSQDGITVRIDTTSTPGSAIAYYHTQSNDDFTRETRNAANNVVDTIPLALKRTDNNQKLEPGASFSKKFTLNSADPKRLLIYDTGDAAKDPATGQPTPKLFESLDQGNTVTPLSLGANLGSISGFLSSGGVAYGGRLNNQNAPDILYVTAFDQVNIKPVILLRETIGGPFTQLTAYPGISQLISIAVDPDDWQRVYVADANNDLYRSVDKGATWEKITGNLKTLASTLGPITIYRRDPAKAGDEVVFIAGFASGVIGGAGVFATDDPGPNANWVQFGTGLPHVLVRDLTYDSTANLLIVATAGRGAWTAAGISDAAGNLAPVVDLNGPAAGNNHAVTLAKGATQILIADAALTVADADSANLTSAAISNFLAKDGAAESLDADVTGTTITKAFQNGVLTLSGTDTVANYQQVLRTVVYTDTAVNPDPTPRVLRVTVNDGISNSVLATSTITLTANPQGPLVDLNGAPPGIDFQTTFTEGKGPVVVALPLLVTGPANLDKVTVAISNLQNGAAELLTATPSGAIAANKIVYNAATGVLTITATAPLADYQQVLRSLTYNNTSPRQRSVTRLVTFIASVGANASPKATGRVLVTITNSAPVLDSFVPYTVGAITSNTKNSAGTAVLDLIASGGVDAFTDNDAADGKGIAITEADNGNGKWQFTSNGGGNWQDFGTLSTTRALFLAGGGPSTRVRFVPNNDYVGTARFQFRAWDLTGEFEDPNGFFDDASTNGGSSPLSTAVGTATINVENPVIAPVNASFAVAAEEAVEGGAKDFVITIQLAAPAPQDLFPQIDFSGNAVLNDPAVPPPAFDYTVKDFNIPPFSVGILKGETSTSFTITIADRAFTDVDKKAIFTINTMAGGITPGPLNTNTLTIKKRGTQLTPPAITSAAGASFVVSAAGTFKVTATGSPIPALTQSGPLPAGITFNATTGVLSGTPAAGTGGTYPLTITAANGTGNNATQNFTLLVTTAGTAPAVTSATTASFAVGAAGSFTVTATGSPTPTFSQTGALPAGVTFNTTSGVLSGTPAAGTAGAFPLTITANNGVGNPSTQNFTLIVTATGTMPAITSAATTTFAVGAAGTFKVVATGSPSPTLSVTGALPSGITFNTATGVLSGTPAAGTVAGTFPLTFTASNGIGNNATQTFSLVVTASTAPPKPFNFFKLGGYRAKDGSWSLDSDGTMGFGPNDQVFFQFSPANVTGVVGDWTGTGRTNIGDFKDGIWHLDLNGNGKLDNGETFTFGQAGDQPIVGDWAGDGISRIGVFRDANDGFHTGQFIEDTNNNRALEATDLNFKFGIATDRVVVGNWNGDQTGSKVGVFRDATAYGSPGGAVFTLDINNNHAYDAGVDSVFIFGLIKDGLVVGDWNGDGKTKVGVYRDGSSAPAGNSLNAPGTALFSLDSNGNLAFDPGVDAVFLFGLTSDQFIGGNWVVTPPLQPSQLVSGSGQGPGAAALTPAELAPAVTQAIDLWAGAGLDAVSLDRLRSLRISIATLNGGALGQETPGQLTLDATAAGWGWSTGTTGQPRKMDLVTALDHEMGHALGLDHSAGESDLLFESLVVGMRKTPTTADVDAVFAALGRPPRL